jgi:hypothetical protein
MAKRTAANKTTQEWLQTVFNPNCILRLSRLAGIARLGMSDRQNNPNATANVMQRIMYDKLKLIIGDAVEIARGNGKQRVDETAITAAIKGPGSMLGKRKYMEKSSKTSTIAKKSTNKKRKIQVSHPAEQFEESPYANVPPTPGRDLDIEPLTIRKPKAPAKPTKKKRKTQVSPVEQFEEPTYANVPPTPGRDLDIEPLTVRKNKTKAKKSRKNVPKTTGPTLRTIYPSIPIYPSSQKLITRGGGSKKTASSSSQKLTTGDGTSESKSLIERRKESMELYVQNNNLEGVQRMAKMPIKWNWGNLYDIAEDNNAANVADWLAEIIMR